MNRLKKIHILPVLAALLSWLHSPAQTPSGDNYNFYTAGSFTPAIQFSNFHNAVSGTDGAVRMNNVSAIDDSHDGLVVAFHFKKISCYDNSTLSGYRDLKLFELAYDNKPFLEGALKGGTLEFKRYYDFPANNRFYTYRLYDSLFGINERNSQGLAASEEMDYTIYLYISDYFIWVETKNPANESTPAFNVIRYAHSPVLWGPNLPVAPGVSGEMNQIVKVFLEKDPKCEVVNKAPFISGPENYAIKIASFQYDFLLSNIKNNVTNPVTAPPLAGKQAQQTSTAGALTVTAAPEAPDKSTNSRNEPLRNRDHAIAGYFEVFPNPANTGNITILSSLTAAGRVQVIITNAAGAVLQQLEYFAAAGRMNKQIVLSPGIRNGLYFVKMKTGGTTGMKKLILTR